MLDRAALRNAKIVEPTSAAGADGASAVSIASVNRKLFVRMGVRQGRRIMLNAGALHNATAVRPDAATSQKGKPAVSMTPLTRQGVLLVKWVLVLLGLSAAAVLLLTIWEDSHGPAALLLPVADALHKQVVMLPLSPDDGSGVASMQKLIDTEKLLLDSISASQKDGRDFILKIGQLILLTIFLPVLTALLGYIFGTRQDGGDQGNTDG